ncbi:MAG: 7-cyano-7-deazaguanine synthase QueC [Candidatus Omnitrophica bacterium]|nr:7-cyano-7-deazaguanine synthase QueC [Candidatus Omnitrophota bacterium]
MKKAVVLLSGGIDSSTTLFFAKKKGYTCHCLIFDYGQRHRKEVDAAKKIAQITNSKSQILKIALPWKGSSLLDKRQSTVNSQQSTGIPSTYVPARNTIFLSYAISFAEATGSDNIFIGANAIDYSGYPDCRPMYFEIFNRLIKVGTKSGVEKKIIVIKTPLIDMTKAQIIKLGARLGVPYELTWSCYKGGKIPCMKCDSCRFRKKGFDEAKIEDPLFSFRGQRSEN